MIVLMTFFSSSLFGQKDESVDREPAVAGRFYSDDPDQLRRDLSILFEKAEPAKLNDVRAIISPHAGYVFSGEVAASSFNQLDDSRTYENIFVIASSHHVSFKGASIYNQGDYVTPLGKVSVNLDLARDLVGKNEVFTFRKDAHAYEHSLEVQLPFLQYKLGEDIRIIPIVIGARDKSDSKLIAEALAPYFNENNLFVISSDFSHYPGYEDAIEVDDATAKAIITNDPYQLIATLGANDDKHISNLATSLCGWTSVLTLLYLTKDNPEIEYTIIDYRNSGDSELYGDKYRVVGYYAIAVTSEKKDTSPAAFNMDQSEQDQLLRLARNTLTDYLSSGKMPEAGPEEFKGRLSEPYGAFVTLNKEGKLRGCIGRFNPELPLFKVVQNMAVAAGTQDYRFPKVQPDELADIEFEISVLSPMKKIESIDEIELGRHGIYIKKGSSSGTFLPQVARHTGWTLEEFLGHCARDKARIGWEGWKDAEIFIYEAFVFSEKTQ